LIDNLYVLAFGAPGTGKTAMMESAFPDLVTVTCNRDTDMDALLGTWIQLPDGTYEWAYGPVAVAAMEGRPVLLDEIAVAPAQVLTDLYESMDGRGTLRIKSNPKLPVIQIKDGFWIGGACNPDAPGAEMSEALLSRFNVHLECTTDYDLAEEIGVPKKFVKAARNLAEKKASDKVTFAHQMRELLAAKRISERLDTEAAVANFISVAPQADRAVVADVVSRVFGYASRGLVTGAAVRTG
jgi:MoxR-like ATPase